MFDAFMLDIENSTEELIKECMDIMIIRHSKLIEEHSGGDAEVKRQLISLYTSNAPKIGLVDDFTSLKSNFGDVKTAGYFDKRPSLTRGNSLKKGVNKLVKQASGLLETPKFCYGCFETQDGCCCPYEKQPDGNYKKVPQLKRR